MGRETVGRLGMVESSCLERGRWDRGLGQTGSTVREIIAVAPRLQTGAERLSGRGLVLGVSVTSCPLPAAQRELFASWH